MGVGREVRVEDKTIWEEEVKEMKFQGVGGISHVDNEITKNYV